jgi:hypothetical protein
VKKSAIFIIMGAALAAPLAHAQSAADNGVFAQALIEGEASAPVPQNQQLASMIQVLQAQTHDTGPVIIQAKRLFWFKQQARCGRVIFSITQPSSGTVLPIGGQLNVCEDGLPPWRVCKDNPSVLIAPQDHCQDNSDPQDTPEISKAIKDALAKGDISHEQVLQQLKDAADKKGIAK